MASDDWKELFDAWLEKPKNVRLFVRRARQLIDQGKAVPGDLAELLIWLLDPDGGLKIIGVGLEVVMSPKPGTRRKKFIENLQIFHELVKQMRIQKAENPNKRSFLKKARRALIEVRPELKDETLDKIWKSHMAISKRFWPSLYREFRK
jgi:hypothetical protein